MLVIFDVLHNEITTFVAIVFTFSQFYA